MTIRNTGTITSDRGKGIDGQLVCASQRHWLKPGDHVDPPALIAYGGTASANTVIYNNNSIISHWTGITGGAVAKANAYGNEHEEGGKGYGGTAVALLVIENVVGGDITSSHGEGIDGKSNADAHGEGFYALGGTAFATTFVTNNATIISHHDGIYGGATANANADGGFKDEHFKGWAVGGTAIAYSYITNSGSVSVKDHGEAIDGQSHAYADASGFTATGGTASAITVITNAGQLVALEGDGIDGIAKAYANAYGSHHTGGAATGGTAFAVVQITNSGPIASTYHSERNPGTGILGVSYAQANAGHFDGWQPSGHSSFTAQGGTAIASTTIVNSGYIHAYGHETGHWDSEKHVWVPGPVVGGDGIDGFATAYAEAHGSRHNGGSTATGGTANATVTIINSYAGNKPAGIIAYYGNGILGASNASADAFGFTAKGGTASATTYIHNTAVIWSDDGIDNYASAFAKGIGSNKFDPPGYGKGGTAVALSLTYNFADINAVYGGNLNGIGIHGTSWAVADGRGRVGIGGTASAITIITNTGNIKSLGDGINGSASASSDGTGSYGAGDKGYGGTAVAVVSISNIGNIVSGDTFGIYGRTDASANGYINLSGSHSPGLSYYGNGVGGHAAASTDIFNSGRVSVSGDSNSVGIGARSYADANGTRTGGTALAWSFVTNSGNVYVVGYGKEDPTGILASSSASADGGHQGGTASAITYVTNAGNITVTGSSSNSGSIYGINAQSSASADGTRKAGLGGTAFAYTGVVSDGESITLIGDAVGILATSQASATGGYQGGTATALTTCLKLEFNHLPRDWR